MRRPITLLVLLALTAAACGDDAGPDPAETAAAGVLQTIEERLGAREEPVPTTIPEGCRIVIETDEYDFETEVLVCDDDPEATTTTTTLPPGSDAVAAWMGGQEARQVARYLGDLVIGQTGCTGRADLDGVAAVVATAPDEVRLPLEAAIAHLEVAAESCDDSDAWRAAMEDALDDLETATAVMRGSDG